MQRRMFSIRLYTFSSSIYDALSKHSLKASYVWVACRIPGRGHDHNSHGAISQLSQLSDPSS